MYSISIGLLTICPYNLSIGLALAAGLGVLWWVASRRGLDAGLALDAALISLILGILAARMEVVLTSLSYFLERPSQIISLQQGGLGGRTLAVVAAGTYLLLVWRKDIRWRSYASLLTPAASIGASILWAGALFWGGFAGEVSGGFLSLTLPDRYGVMAPRLPLQAIMAVANLAFAGCALTFLESRLQPGMSLALWGSSTAALAALLANFRSDQTLLAGMVPSSALVYLGLTLVWVALGALLYSFPDASCLAGQDPYTREG